MKVKAGVVVAERFRLVRPIGQGGMGEVWLAHHTVLDVPCAVKFLRDKEAARSSSARTRFLREARVAAQLRSPHVVHILDHGMWWGTPYIAMEWLDGEDLGCRLRRERVLSTRDTFAIAVQVARALARAHAAGLVHRDLKPANIFLVRDGEQVLVKVLDFGVAKVRTERPDEVTDTGVLLGTPSYMSPEQARGLKSIDHRADLWALAVVIFRCLVGELPFQSEFVGELLVKIITGPPPVPSALGAVPPGFDDFWKRATASNPDRRFQSAKELIDALAQVFGAAGVDLAPPGELAITATLATPLFSAGSPDGATDESPTSVTTEDTQDTTRPTVTPHGRAAALATVSESELTTKGLGFLHSRPELRWGLVAAAVGGVLAGAVMVGLRFHEPQAVPNAVLLAPGPDAPSSTATALPSSSAAVLPSSSAAVLPSSSAAVLPSSSAAVLPSSSAAVRPVRPSSASSSGKRRTNFGF